MGGNIPIYFIRINNPYVKHVRPKVLITGCIHGNEPHASSTIMGFIGSLFVIGLFVGLFLRIIYLAERQKTKFSRVYGYCVAGILFIHFFVNIAMVLGIFPTIGVPLPFFSYGGSGLWGFTILLFIFIKMDANKVNEW